MLNAAKEPPMGLAIASQSADFWRRMAPELTISNWIDSNDLKCTGAQLQANRARLVDDGYLHLKQPGIDAPYATIEKVMRRIVDAGMPAAFIGVYDEVWEIAAQLQSVLQGCFGGDFAMVPDFWASFSESGHRGVAAHRKRPGTALFRDHTPKSLSVWVPVTNATVENGCIYIVPAKLDKNYASAVSDRADAHLQCIRALPAQSGDVLIWTGEAYHWKAVSSRHSGDGPLLSLSWEFQSMSAAPVAGFLVDCFPQVSFEDRLGLLAHQMPQHRNEYSGSPVWRAVQQTLSNRFPVAPRFDHV